MIEDNGVWVTVRDQILHKPGPLLLDGVPLNTEAVGVRGVSG